jgi:hypothetical protein
MLLPLPANGRRALVRYACAACGVSLALLPLAMRSESSVEASPVSSHPVLPPLPVTDSPRATSWKVTRNPFAPDERTNPGLPGNLVAEGDSIRTLLVRAVVLGSAPKALLEVNGRLIVVGVGGTIGSAKIEAIDGQGVVLDDGDRLALVRETP